MLRHAERVRVGLLPVAMVALIGAATVMSPLSEPLAASPVEMDTLVPLLSAETMVSAESCAPLPVATKGVLPLMLLEVAPETMVMS